MQLSPRYEGPVVVAIEDDPSIHFVPLARQRRRFRGWLTDLSDAQWAHPSRCDGWGAREVVAHLVTVNEFWVASIVAGLAGKPTRYLAEFDPAATPPLLVGMLGGLSPDELLERFEATNEALIETLAPLTDDQWTLLAESPAGHVPISVLAHHGLWDSWIHERDVALPLGLTTEIEVDEVTSCLRFAAVASPVLGLGMGRTQPGLLTVDATGPDTRFAVHIDDDVVRLRNEFDDASPCLRGDAVELTEALSLRRPMPDSAPNAWKRALGGLEAAFDK